MSTTLWVVCLSAVWLIASIYHLYVFKKVIRKMATKDKDANRRTLVAAFLILAALSLFAWPVLAISWGLVRFLGLKKKEESK